ncbi:MAG: hypothetical protein JXR18_06055 [Neptuniibacter sp.]
MKNIKTAWMLALFPISTVLFSTGCKTLTDVKESAEAYEFRRGIVSLVESQVLFSPCFEQKSEVINDLTYRLNDRFILLGEPAVYTEISGRRDPSTALWEVHRVHLIGGGKQTCSYELEGNDFRAAGDNPLWIADIREDFIHVQNVEKLTKLKFKKPDLNETSSGLEWNSEMSGEIPHKLSLRLRYGHCTDSYGTEYELRAEMVLDGKSMKGCARKGNLDLQSLPGIYKGKTSSIEGARSITLVLTAEGQVRIIQDYDNDQPIIVHKGTWQRLPKKKLVVYLDDVTGSQQGEVLLLKRNQRGALELRSSSAIYGGSGLQFFRIGSISAITQTKGNN